LLVKVKVTRLKGKIIHPTLKLKVKVIVKGQGQMLPRTLIKS